MNTAQEHAAPSMAMTPYQAQTMETSAAASSAMAVATVQARFVMALQRPRDLETVRVKLKHECKRPAFAEVALWSRPVGSEKNPQTGEWEEVWKDGLSIRFMEAAARLMGNILTETPAIYDDERMRKVRVSVTDLETNVTHSKDVTVPKTEERRRPLKGAKPLGVRENSYGDTVYLYPASDDKTSVKEAAIVSKTLRVLLGRIVPGDILDQCFQELLAARSAQVQANPDEARQKIADAFFAELKVSPAELAEYLGHPLEQIVPKEIEKLRAIYVACRDGELVWADLLEDRRASRAPAAEGATKGESPIAAKVRAATEKAKTPGEPTPAPAAPPPTPTQAASAVGPAGQQTLGAVDPPKEEAPAKAPRKSLDEQRLENRATVDQTIVTIREYEDLRELETWAAGWKASKTRTALPSALRQEVDKVLEEHRARLREAGAQEEPGASG